MRSLALLAMLLMVTALVGCQKQQAPAATPIDQTPAPRSTLGGDQSYSADPATDAGATDAAAPLDSEPIGTVDSGSSVSSAGAHTYVVKSGDTMFKIVREQLGVTKGIGAKIDEIKALNPGLNPGKITKGQKIKLPAK